MKDKDPKFICGLCGEPFSTRGSMHSHKTRCIRKHGGAAAFVMEVEATRETYSIRKSLTGRKKRGELTLSQSKFLESIGGAVPDFGRDAM